MNDTELKRVSLPTGDTGNVTSDENVSDGVKRVASSTKRSRARKSDAPPKRRASAPKAEQASTLTSAELEFALAQVLSFPAVPAKVAGDDWAADHFATQGPVLAKELAKFSDRNPAVRRILERIATGEAVGTLAFASIMYALPPLVHWGIIPVPGNMRGFVGVPSPVDPTTGQTAAQAMDTEPGNTSATSNGTTRTERHTP